MLIGITGKPSTGKSTFFKAATLADVEIANYPFTTIKPNHAVGYVKVACMDMEFGVQCNPRFGYCLQHKRFIPVDLLDVAGLIPGAHAGAGLGSEFLDDLNQANALIHVIDISGSTNEKGEAVDPGSYDPANDILFLEEELDQWYLRILNKGWEKFARQVRQENANVARALAKQLSGLRVTEDIAKEVLREEALNEDILSWDANALKHLASAMRKKTKPMVIAANKIDVSTGKENYLRLVKMFPKYTIVPCSAESEVALREAARKELIQYIPGEKNFTVAGKLNEKQEKALQFIQKNVLDAYGSTGVQLVLDTIVFDVLKMVAIFPGGVNKLEDKDGNVLPDCFLLQHGATALDFAYHLHTDIGEGFIRAIDVKTKRAVGKEYVLKHRDVIEIVTRK